MDAERFGRVLGLGVRAAGGALKTAASAAAAPNPRPVQPLATKSPAASPPAPIQAAAGQAGRITARGVVQTRVTAAGVKQGSKRFGQAIWGPAARAGGVLWFEVTGVFFALFALAAAVETWHRRLALFAPSDARGKAWFSVAMLVAFSWFTLSSFINARRRARRP